MIALTSLRKERVNNRSPVWSGRHSKKIILISKVGMTLGFRLKCSKQLNKFKAMCPMTYLFLRSLIWRTNMSFVLFPFWQEWNYHKETSRDWDEDPFFNKNVRKQSLIGRIKTIVISPTSNSIQMELELSMAGMCLDKYDTPNSSSNKDISTPLLIQLVMLLILSIHSDKWNATLWNSHLLVIKIGGMAPLWL